MSQDIPRDVVTAMIDEAFTKGYNAGYEAGWNHSKDPDVKKAFDNFLKDAIREAKLEGEQ